VVLGTKPNSEKRNRNLFIKVSCILLRIISPASIRDIVSGLRSAVKRFL
jgi:hypothetical protein